MNYWTITFPCLMFLARFGAYSTARKSMATLSVNVNGKAMGTTFHHELARTRFFQLIIASWSISLALSLLPVIILRFGLRRRDV